MLRKLFGITFSCILTPVCSRNACKSRYDNKTNRKSHMFFKGLHKSIKIRIIIMIFVIPYLMNTIHPNLDDKNYYDIFVFLLGWPGLPNWPRVADWHGLAVGGDPGLFYCLGTIWELSGILPDGPACSAWSGVALLARLAWLAGLAGLAWLACLPGLGWPGQNSLQTCPLRLLFLYVKPIGLNNC